MSVNGNCCARTRRADSALPPPLRGRAGEGGSPKRRRLWLTEPTHRRPRLIPLPPLLRSVDLPLKGEVEHRHDR
jgi:hypothetical protein